MKKYYLLALLVLSTSLLAANVTVFGGLNLSGKMSIEEDGIETSKSADEVGYTYGLEINKKVKNLENGEIDLSFEHETTPLEKEFEREQRIKQKEELYLNDNFIIQQFHEKMKEYPDYRVIGEPKITYHDGYTYNINFNATHYFGGYPNGYPSKENITVQIILDLETETYTFTTIKGDLY